MKLCCMGWKKSVHRGKNQGTAPPEAEREAEQSRSGMSPADTPHSLGRNPEGTKLEEGP